MTREKVVSEELDARISVCVINLLKLMADVQLRPFDVRICTEFLHLITTTLDQPPPEGCEHEAKHLLTEWLLYNNLFVGLENSKVVLVHMTPENLETMDPEAVRLWKLTRADVLAARAEAV